MAGRKPITAEQAATLRAAYLRGDKYATAQLEANVSSATVGRAFTRLRAEGLERGARAPRARLQGVGVTNRKYPGLALPRYTGPDWIGVRIRPPLDAESRM